MQIRKCRICYSQEFSPLVNLGTSPLADAFLTEAQLSEPETYYPLEVVQCDECGLVQLAYVVSRELLYPADYPYLSSTTATGRKHYDEMAGRICAKTGIRSGLAVDIGSNVGVLLEGFKRRGLEVLGVEPVGPIAQRANLAGIPTLAAFFEQRVADSILGYHGPAAIITGTNVVAHIDDIRGLMLGIRSLLADNGVFVFEAPYLYDLLDGMAYDTIYHEHLSYLALRPIERLCRDTGLAVFDVERQAIHGGTIRYYIARHGDYIPSRAVAEMREAESNSNAFHMFGERVADHRRALRALLGGLGKARIAAVSAPAKGMTLLNYTGIGDQLMYVTEKAETKIGRYTPGARVPVVSDDRLLDDMPDYALILAWNFADEIMANLSEYEKRGGRFIIPMPIPSIVLPRVTGNVVF